MQPHCMLPLYHFSHTLHFRLTEDRLSGFQSIALFFVDQVEPYYEEQMEVEVKFTLE